MTASPSPHTHLGHTLSISTEYFICDTSDINIFFLQFLENFQFGPWTGIDSSSVGECGEQNF